MSTPNIDESFTEQKIWDALSKKLRKKGIRFKNIQDSFRLILAHELYQICERDLRSKFPNLLEEFIERIDVSTFDRLLKAPALEFRQNSALKAISIVILDKPANEFLRQSSLQVDKTRPRQKESVTTATFDASTHTKILDAHSTPFEWAEMFAQKFPELWQSLTVEFQNNFPHCSYQIEKEIYQNAKIFVWLALEIAIRCNISDERAQKAVRDITRGGAPTPDLNMFMSAIYHCAELPVPRVYRRRSDMKAAKDQIGTRKLLSLGDTIRALARDERTKQAWKHFAEPYKNRATEPLSDKKILDVLVRIMSVRLEQTLDRTQTDWRLIFAGRASESLTTQYIDMLHEIVAREPFTPSLENKLAKTKSHKLT